jgi:hypothetical protein
LNDTAYKICLNFAGTGHLTSDYTHMSIGIRVNLYPPMNMMTRQNLYPPRVWNINIRCTSADPTHIRLTIEQEDTRAQNVVPRTQGSRRRQPPDIRCRLSHDDNSAALRFCFLSLEYYPSYICRWKLIDILPYMILQFFY